jgi:hypothetical protein
MMTSRDYAMQMHGVTHWREFPKFTGVETC